MANNYYTNKIIKLTKAQYDSLKSGASINDYTLDSKDIFVLDIDSLYRDIPKKTSELTNDSGYITTSEVDSKLSSKANTNHTHSVATTSKSGFMSSSDKAILNSLNTNALKYIYLSSGGYVPVTDGVAIIQIFSTAVKTVTITAYNGDDSLGTTLTLSVKGWIQIHFESYDGQLNAVYCNSSGAMTTYYNNTGVQEGYIEITLPKGTFGCALSSY